MMMEVVYASSRTRMNNNGKDLGKIHRFIMSGCNRRKL
jgi:hypothetical protein